MGRVAGVYSAPKRHKTEVRFRLDEQGHNGTYATNPGLPAEAGSSAVAAAAKEDAAKANQSQSK